MGIKSGFLSIHNGGSGASNEMFTVSESYSASVTTSFQLVERPYVTFNLAQEQGVMASDRAITFVTTSFAYPRGAYAISSSTSGTLYAAQTLDNIAPLPKTVGQIKYWQISGTIVAPATPFNLMNSPDGDPDGSPPDSKYGVRVSLCDTATGNTYREPVYFNGDVPFTVTAVTNSINFAAGALTVLP